MSEYFRSRRPNASNDDRLSSLHLYLDVDTLKSYCLTETGQIAPSRISGVSAKTQRHIAEAVKRARFLALIPYCDNHRR